jgi:4-hydroxy-3-methylbut-2-enyl diphosphate reductase
MMTDENMTPTTEAEIPPVGDPEPDASETVPAAESTTAPEPEVEQPAAQEETPVAEATVAAVPEAEPASAPVAEQEPVVEAQPVEAVIEAPAAELEAAEAEAAEAAEAAADDSMLFEAAMRELETSEDSSSYEGAFKKLSKGDRVEATVIQVDKDRVFVDLGTKSEGIVPIGELAEGAIESAADHVKVGDKISVVVLKPEGTEGNPIVSKRRADFEEIWDRIEAAFRDGEPIKAQVVDRVKGGLVVDVGVRGFVPATHVGSGKLRNIEKFVGSSIDLKIIEIDRDRKKVVLSNRQAEEERRAHAKEDIFNNVAPGDVLEGTVRRLTDYGAFVDLGGVDGLLHISEMSWMRINHPREVFKEGQQIKVMVLRLDAASGKISLGHRQVLPDPWNLIRDNYRIGLRFTCKIGRLVQSGAFVKLPEGAEAFMPVSEISNRRIKKPSDLLEEGQDVEVQVLDLRPDERRMVLSMRAIGGADANRAPSAGGESFGDDEDRRRAAGKKGKKRGRRGEDDDVEELAGRRGFASGGATIGERLGMLKGFLGRDDDEEEVEETNKEAEPEE